MATNQLALAGRPRRRYRPRPMTPKRVALVHDWLTGMRGGEKCLEVLCELFPEATLFTLLHKLGSVSPTIEALPIRTSFVQRLPFAASKFRHYLPLFPRAVERFDLSDFDLVISSSHCVAKSVIPRPGALHLCYCHTPMRYVWDLFDEYFGVERVGRLKHALLRRVAGRLRRWDARTADRVHHFVANSQYVRRRIQRHYRRDADVIHPPVDTTRFTLSERNDNYFLMVTALVPYKRVELAVEAFNRLGARLLIVGSGPEERRLQEQAKKNIEFLGWQSDEQIRGYYAGCQALIFPGEEDFGIVPVEAMATGKPALAFGRGGALETVVPGVTGLLFPEQTVSSLMDAVRSFDEAHFSPQRIRTHALGFDREVYRRNMREFIADKCERHFPQPQRVAA
jgi:glycosyltransferase involved in cell wall biosynthesis